MASVIYSGGADEDYTGYDLVEIKGGVETTLVANRVSSFIDTELKRVEAITSTKFFLGDRYDDLVVAILLRAESTVVLSPLKNLLAIKQGKSHIPKAEFEVLYSPSELYLFLASFGDKHGFDGLLKKFAKSMQNFKPLPFVVDSIDELILSMKKIKPTCVKVENFYIAVIQKLNKSLYG